ncbi:hypothetical protein ACFQI3_11530 [Hansschlegelia quercus]|uniref:Uncharacterized protein n=1 Tax=Hansschlegelia quercus TaxID=2528245 RepID=A0A4Q9GHN2_9HYPH|nr:hypothetical protein [Hansschlegelia quercus]TBN53508.1 hypothetical protein EYR15_10905 [Hansschlegelia quercus]
MPDRTTETTVMFRRPFSLAGINGAQPAGTYLLVIDEEEIPGISFLAYRRTATTIHTPAIAVRSGLHKTHLVERADLEAALDADRKSAAPF